MESGQSADVPTHQPTSLNETNEVGSPSDIMIRRLKNRERQRRYRARKRLEAERKTVQTSQLLQHHGADIRSTHAPRPQDEVISQRKKEHTNAQSALVATELPVNDTLQHFASRVYCQRDWKRDARRVHLHNNQVVRCNDYFALEQTAVGGNQIQSFSALLKVDPAVVNGVQQGGPLMDNDGTRRAVPGRRHWKVEARNKKG